MTKDLASQALRTALDPQGSWMPAVLKAADTRLSEIRSHVPDAGGLVIATDQTAARAYAELLRATAPVPARSPLKPRRRRAGRRRPGRWPR